MSDANPVGWYQDPTGQGDARYWNGASWTESVNRGGVTTNVAIDPSQAQLAPAPGTQVSIPPPPTQSASGGSSSSSSMGLVVGIIVVILIGALIYAFVNNDSSDSPTPGTDTPATSEAPATTEAPAATEAPAPSEAPADEGG